MRKYVIGMCIGFALSFAVGAHAEIVSMVGKTIDGSFPVKISGKQLEQSAVVVEGTSYLPVRAIGDALNMDVAFNADLGIELKQKETTPIVTLTTPEPMQPVNTPTRTKTYTAQQLDIMIEDKKVNIQGLKSAIDHTDQSQSMYSVYKERLQKYESELTDLEKQKAELLK